MSHGVDTVVVAMLLLAAVIYAALSLGPRALRRRLLAGIGSALARLPPVWGVRGLRDRTLRAASRGGGACGGCDDCGAGEAAGEVRVPVAQIARRVRR